MTDTLFSRIIAGELPADIVHRDERCIAFRDVNPQAPLHVLVVPITPVASLADAEDCELLGHLLRVASRVAADAGYADSFRVVINNGAAAGQTVFHLHVHVLAGRPLSWPPG